jgi:hypothetical protein
MACISRKTAAVHFLIELGVDPAMPVCLAFLIAIALKSQLIGFTFTATLWRPISVMRLLNQSYAYANAEDDDGVYPLRFAVHRSSPENGTTSRLLNPVNPSVRCTLQRSPLKSLS